MTELNNQKIYFTENTAEIISAILQKYNLNETAEELEKKLHKEKLSPLNGATVLSITIMAVKKEIPEKDIPNLLQNKLNITPKTAEDLTNDIKTRLIAIATTKKPIPKPDLESEDSPVKKNKPPIGLPKIGEEMKNVIIPQELTINLEKKNLPKKEKIKKTTIQENNKEASLKPKQSSGLDTYREPIE